MKILVSDDVSMKGVELLRENGYEVDVKKNLDEQGLIDCIGEYDGLITRSMTHVTEKVIEAATKLKVVGRASSSSIRRPPIRWLPQNTPVP